MLECSSWIFNLREFLESLGVWGETPPKTNGHGTQKMMGFGSMFFLLWAFPGSMKVFSGV